MAYIPYGYMIKNGRAEINEEEQQQITDCFNAYLAGHSYRECIEGSKIRRSVSGVRTMLLRADIYAGDDFYPRLLEQSFIDKVQRTMRARKIEKPGRKKREPLRVYTSFALLPPFFREPSPQEVVYADGRTVEEETPLKAAERIYESILNVSFSQSPPKLKRRSPDIIDHQLEEKKETPNASKNH